MKDQIQIIKSARQEKEPTFTLRAKDKCSIIALAAYNVACKVMGVNSEHVIETNEIYRNFIDYQFHNPDKVKLPD